MGKFREISSCWGNIVLNGKQRAYKSALHIRTLFRIMHRTTESTHRFVLLSSDTVFDCGIHRLSSALVVSGGHRCGHLYVWCFTSWRDQGVPGGQNVYLSLDEFLQVGKVDCSAFFLLQILILLSHLFRYVLHATFSNIRDIVSPVQLIQLTDF